MSLRSRLIRLPLLRPRQRREHMGKRSRIVLPPEEYKKLCVAIMNRDGWRCRCCRVRKNLHVHHIVFRSHGGDDADWNLITICSRCHTLVHQPDPRTGTCVVIVSVSEKDIVDANDKKDTKFLLVNWPKGKKL